MSSYSRKVILIVSMFLINQMNLYLNHALPESTSQLGSDFGAMVLTPFQVYTGPQTHNPALLILFCFTEGYVNCVFLIIWESRFQCESAISYPPQGCLCLHMTYTGIREYWES